MLTYKGEGRAPPGRDRQCATPTHSRRSENGGRRRPWETTTRTATGRHHRSRARAQGRYAVEATPRHGTRRHQSAREGITALSGVRSSNTGPNVARGRVWPTTTCWPGSTNPGATRTTVPTGNHARSRSSSGSTGVVAVMPPPPRGAEPTPGPCRLAAGAHESR
ncbi:hypothetical protein F4561_003150 [Lipingzhangella halophila]|uniref:Uncharacterized protein n=1 Tax=Lipingzhangella halophila TaxID=1783352 RepID=A0A7W7RI52_9ACTN|nr:hypothetical protein [Lipingzhangella halophila]